ncbi:MAG: LuxR C-terminal-related transcriptional regulator [Bacteroidota bacterium]
MDESKNILEKLVEQVKQNENMLGPLASILPAIVYVTSLKTLCVLWTNTEVYSRLGYEEEEIKGMKSALFRMKVHPDDQKLLKDSLEFFRKKPKATWTGVYRFMHANGEWRWMSSSNILFRFDLKGSPSQSLGVAVDITDRIQSENMMRELTRENLQLKNKLVTSSLTKREKEIIRLVIQGNPTKIIADTLSISVSTAETHRKNIMRKLDVHNVAELIKYSSENGLF